MALPPLTMPGPLYSPAERVRRDATVWTLVQGILAPVQFLVFIVSLVLVCRALMTGEGEMAAMISVLIKTAVLLTIMVTGAIWERVVFGRYLFAPAFFWEDVMSMGVIALHVAYATMVLADIGGTTLQLQVALAAYAAYLVNAAQFVNKLRLARRSEERLSGGRTPDAIRARHARAADDAAAGAAA